MSSTYSPDELSEIRSAIAQRKEPRGDLLRKIEEDPVAENLGMVGFFPAAYPLAYGSELSPALDYVRGNRGYIFLLRHPEKSIVIKRCQSAREAAIARLADELGVGPKQYESIDGYLTEELINAPTLIRLPPERRTPAEGYSAGRRIGEMLNALHAAGIYYNDNILSDDLDRCHVFSPENSPAVLFDYGVALDASGHARWSDDEVFDFVRTLPEVKLAGILNPDRVTKEVLVEELRPFVASFLKREILGRDENFVLGELQFLSYKAGVPYVRALADGFTETYRE